MQCIFSVTKKAWVVPDPHWWRSSAPEKKKNTAAKSTDKETFASHCFSAHFAVVLKEKLLRTCSSGHFLHCIVNTALLVFAVIYTSLTAYVIFITWWRKYFCLLFLSLGSPFRSSYHPWFSCLLSKYLPRNPTLAAHFRSWWDHCGKCRCKGKATFN